MTNDLTYAICNLQAATNEGLELDEHECKGEKTKEMNDNVVSYQPQSYFTPKNISDKFKLRIDYEYLLWTVFILTTVLCVVDGFFKSGDVVCGRASKNPSRLWTNNLGETITNVIWRITSRLIIPAQNMMFFTASWCIPNILSDICPSWISLNGIKRTHIRIHRLIGIYLIAIPSLLHVLAIFIPPLVDGSAITYYPHSSCNKTKDEFHWTDIFDPAAIPGWSFNDQNGVHLTSDELYRFFLMIFIFCVLFPLSRSEFLNRRSYSFAIAIHVFAGIWYSIDNIRKATHTLAHLLNFPLMLLWFIDRMMSIFIYQKNEGRIVKKIMMEDYIIVLLKLKDVVNSTMGDTYYILNKSLQRSHPFTSFSNHSNENSCRAWDIGFIISVMKEKDKKWCNPFTRWLVSLSEDSCKERKFNIWGPYRSTGYRLFHNINSKHQPNKCILISTGSGFGYMLDVFSFIAHSSSSVLSQSFKFEMIYVTRSAPLLEFFTNEFSNLYEIFKTKNLGIEINFKAYLTSEKSEILNIPNCVECTIGKRPEFDRYLSRQSQRTEVFFIGNTTVANKVQNLCKKYNLNFYRDVAEGFNKGDKKELTFYLITGIKVTAYTVLVCVILHLHVFMGRLKI